MPLIEVADYRNLDGVGCPDVELRPSGATVLREMRPELVVQACMGAFLEEVGVVVAETAALLVAVQRRWIDLRRQRVHVEGGIGFRGRLRQAVDFISELGIRHAFFRVCEGIPPRYATFVRQRAHDGVRADLKTTTPVRIGPVTA